MQKSYTDWAIHIVCIFGLTGQVFSQTLVGSNIKKPQKRKKNFDKKRKINYGD